MKNLMIALTTVLLTSSFAFSAPLKNCYTAKDVRKGEFIVGLSETLTGQETKKIEDYLNQIGLTVIDKSIGMLLVKSTKRSTPTPAQQKTQLTALAKLLGPQVDFISCNRLVSLD